MKERLVLCVLTFAVLSTPDYGISLETCSPQIKAALNYFKSNQQDNGGFGDGGKTEWVMMAIAATGQDPRAWQRHGKTPMDYLRRQKVTTNPYDWIRMVLVLAAVGENPRSWEGTDFISKIKALYHQKQFGDPLSLRDDFWAIMALAAAGETQGPNVADSVDFILKHQNEDGSWGSSTTGIEIGADNTAAAILALLAAGHRADSIPILKAKSYLRSVQDPDGGFPYLFVSSNAATDALVIQAFNSSSDDASLVKNRDKNVISHLLGLQDADGSFRWTQTCADSALMMTAYAVPALVGAAYPIRPASSSCMTIDLRIEGKDGIVLHHPVTLSSSPATPLSLLTEACKQAGIDHELSWTRSGVYLQGVQGQRDAWQYRVNDRLPMEPADTYKLAGGDELIWFYDPEECKSPLRLVPQTCSCCAGDTVSLHVEQFEDEAGQWKRCRDRCFVIGEAPYPVERGTASIRFAKEGVYPLYAEKQDGIRSRKKTIIVEHCKPITVSVRVEADARMLWKGTVACSGVETADINGKTVAIRRPVLLSALEGARRSKAVDYTTIRTAQGLILVSINGLKEDNEHGSWWYEVNGKKINEDIDEYLLKDGDEVLFYRSLAYR